MVVVVVEIVVEDDEEEESEKEAEEKPLPPLNEKDNGDLPLPPPSSLCKHLLRFAFTVATTCMVGFCTTLVPHPCRRCGGFCDGAAAHGSGISKSISSINKEIHSNSLTLW